ncbi:MAG TPA: hypothetical protein VFU63_01330 [Ktedonobacterales bacterium]|nr:hypothetical protein [Ktedonobacterales bacterium]
MDEQYRIPGPDVPTDDQAPSGAGFPPYSEATASSYPSLQPDPPVLPPPPAYLPPAPQPISQSYYHPPAPVPPQGQWQTGPTGSPTPSVPLQQGQQGYYHWSRPLPPQQQQWQSGAASSSPPPSIPLLQGQQGYYQQPAAPPQGYYQLMVQPVVMVQQQTDSSAAVLVECICGFFGFYGIGWLMSGYTTTGILLLLGGFVWKVLFWLIVLGTGFVGLICMGPIDLAIWITSGVILSNTLKKRSMGIIR